jgi:aminoglycoside phosphotransferase (APT) family kinase protein
MARDTAALASGLQRFLDRGGRITGVKTLSAGHSNETYLVEGLDEILRMPPSEEGLLPPYDMARQHAILSAVKKHAPTVPLPRLRELCTDRSVLGDEFFLMERMPGEAFEYQTPDWVKSDPIGVPERLCRQWFEAIVGLHRMDPAKMPPGGRTVATGTGSTLTLSGGGGTPNTPYILLASTNVALSVPAWDHVTTNQFDSSGNFSISMPVTPGVPQQFFLIQLP